MNNFKSMQRLKGTAQNKINTADMATAKKNTNDRYFKERLTIGQRGEFIVKEFLLKHGYNYIDCTRNSKMLSLEEIKAWEAVEVDLIIESRLDYQEKKVEVKASTRKIKESTHLCVKVSSHYVDEKQRALRGDDAYLYRTQADYIFFVCLEDRDIYSIRTKDLIDYIEGNTASNNTKNVYWKTYFDKNNIPGMDRYNKCAYVNIKDLLDKKLLKKINK